MYVNKKHLHVRSTQDDGYCSKIVKITFKHLIKTIIIIVIHIRMFVFVIL